MWNQRLPGLEWSKLIRSVSLSLRESQCSSNLSKDGSYQARSESCRYQVSDLLCLTSLLESENRAAFYHQAKWLRARTDIHPNSLDTTMLTQALHFSLSAIQLCGFSLQLFLALEKFSLSQGMFLNKMTNKLGLADSQNSSTFACLVLYHEKTMLNVLSKYKDSLKTIALENLSDELFGSFCSFSYVSLQGQCSGHRMGKTNKHQLSLRTASLGETTSSAIKSMCAVLAEKPHSVASTHSRRLTYNCSLWGHLLSAYTATCHWKQ